MFPEKSQKRPKKAKKNQKKPKKSQKKPLAMAFFNFGRLFANPDVKCKIFTMWGGIIRSQILIWVKIDIG